jgi:hypothetical protein
MFSFQQLCEFLTQGQRYAWFYLPSKLWDCLSKEDKQLCHLERIDEDLLRLHYPKARFYREAKMMDKLLLYKLLNEAVENNDFDKLKELKEYMAV